MRPKVKRLILFAPLAIVGMIVFAAFGGEVVKLLWNWLLPSLFGFRQITFWQGLGVLALSRILFGGFGFHGNGHRGMRRRMRDNWDSLTPEERERFRERMRERWGYDPTTPTGAGEA